MKKIKKIRDGFLSRNTALVKYAFKTGSSLIANRNNPQKALEDILGRDVHSFVDDLSHYKGSITKAGQILSQYGEYFLDPEIVKVLRKLQSSTHFLDFNQLVSQVPERAIEDLDIEPSPLAAASIGQVHLATHKKSLKKLVLKIQYKGIDKAIGGDLFFIKLLVKNLKIFPRGVDLTNFFNEIQSVLIGEMDYAREREFQSKYSEILDDSYFKVPKIYNEYSNEKVIALEYVEGISIGDIPILTQNKEKRDTLGQKLFENFLKEIFVYHLIQTDAHGANFIATKELDSLYLIDFGACLGYQKETLNFYRNFLKYGYLNDKENFLDTFYNFWKSSGKSVEIDEDLLWEYVVLTCEPLHSNNFKWGKTDLPDRAYPLAKELFRSMKYKSAPSEFIFIDRKLIGLFSLLRKLECEFDVEQSFTNIAHEYLNSKNCV